MIQALATENSNWVICIFSHAAASSIYSYLDVDSTQDPFQYPALPITTQLKEPMDDDHPTLSERYHYRTTYVQQARSWVDFSVLIRAPETADRIEVSTPPSQPSTASSSSPSKLSTLTIVPEQLDENLNSIPPINQLPTEILITIFEESIYVPELSQWDIPHIQKLKYLASVCLWWNKIIKDTPHLWAVVESNVPNELVPIILRKSGQSTLAFKCCEERVRLGSPEYDVEEQWPSDDLLSFLTITLSELHRWRSALFQLSRGNVEILWQLEQPAPFIERMDFEIFHWPWRELNLFSGYAPNLRWIHIVDLPFIWSQGVFHDLRHLHIELIKLPQLTVEDILLTVQSSPNLQTLRLELMERSIVQTQQPNFPEFRLEFLERLSLTGMPPSAAHTILAHIRAPHLRCLTVYPDHQTGDFDGLKFIDTIISHFLPMNHLNLGDSHTLRLLLDSNFVGIRVLSDTHYPQDCIGIRIPHNSSLHTLQTIIETIIHSLVPRSPIILFIEEFPLIAWSDLGGILSSLEEVVALLVWTQQLDRQVDFFKFLSTPLDVCGVKKWLFPKLAEIVLPLDISGEQAVQLVRARYNMGTLENGAAAQDGAMPCPLTMLDVSWALNLDVEQLSEITNIVGLAVIRQPRAGDFTYSALGSEV